MHKFIFILRVSLTFTFAALLGSGCSSKARLAKELQQADAFFAQGDYDHAEAKYQAVFDADRLSAHAVGRLGVIFLEQGRLGKAYPYLNRSLQLDTNDLEMHFKYGQFCQAAGRPKEAREQANIVLTARPDDQEAPQLLADTSVTARDVDAAIARLEHLELPEAKMGPAATALATLYSRKNDLKGAQAAFVRARAANPNSAVFYANLGSFYWNQNQLKLAEEALKRAAELSPVRSPRRLRYAQFKVERGELTEAKELLSETEKAAPDYLPASLALADIAAGEGHYDLARTKVDAVLNRDPENFDALMLDARLATLMNDPNRAINAYEKATKIYSHAPQVFYQLAKAYMSVNDTTKAMAALNQTLAVNSNYVDASLAMAQLKYQKGDSSAAVVALRQVIQQHPQYLSAYLLLADAYHALGNNDEAISVYKKAEQIAPRNPQAPLMLGMLYAQLRRDTDARQQFDLALDIAPNYTSALEQLVALEVVERHFDNALRLIGAFHEKYPNIQDTAIFTAKVYVAMRQPDKARDVLVEAIDNSPDYQAGYLMLGHLYEALDQRPKAVEIFQELLKRHPENVEGLMESGIVLEQIGDKKGAQHAYEELLDKNPNFAAALNNLAGIYLEEGENSKAYDLARRAHDLMPYDPSTDDTLGWALFNRGAFNQAEPLLQESVAKLGAMPDVQAHLGMTRYMLGDEEGARASLQLAVQSKNDFSGKATAVRTLAILNVVPEKANPADVDLLKQAIKDQPSDVVAASRLAAVYVSHGDLKSATSLYENLLKIDAKNVEALIALAKIDSRESLQNSKAYNYALTAYKVNPADARVCQVFGPLAYEAGDYRLALTSLTEAAKSQPLTSDEWFYLAEAQYANGLISEAIASTQAALKAGGSFKQSAQVDGFLRLVPLAADPRPALANQALAQQTLAKNPHDLTALVTTAIIAEQKGDNAAAEKTFSQVVETFPDFTPAKRHLALLYAQDGSNDKKAIAYARAVHQSSPSDLEITRALGVLSYRSGDLSSSVRYLKEAVISQPEDARLRFYLGMGQYRLKEKADSKKNLELALNLKLPDDLTADAKKALADLNSAKR